MKEQSPVVAKKYLHLFKHSRMNFYVRTKRYFDSTGTRRYASTKKKRKNPKYKPAPDASYEAQVAAMRKRTKRGRDEAVARHRAEAAARNTRTKRELAEVIASLSAEERAALVASPHVITAVEKIIEAMLFRFSA